MLEGFFIKKHEEQPFDRNLLKKPKLWQHHVIGPLQTNCYILANQMSEAILIDPGGPEAIQIVHDLSRQGISVTHVLVTHGHFDHLGWAPDVQKAVEGARVYLHVDEKDVFEQFFDMMRFFGMKKPETLREPDVWIKDDQVLDLSGIKIRVLHTPGHSPGSVTYVLQESREAYVGDCIFKNSIGRVDLPFSDPNLMIQSLTNIITHLSDDYHLFPGHGPDTWLRDEKRSNPFLLALQRGTLMHFL